MRAFRVVLVLIVLPVALFVLYLLAGLSSPATCVDYSLNLDGREDGLLQVTMVITPPLRPFLHLYLRDARQEDTRRVTDFTVKRGEQEVASWQTVPGWSDLRTIGLGLSRRPVTVTYRLQALWKKGPDSPRSYLGPSFGYLRGMVTLYSPVSLPDIVGMVRNADTYGNEAGLASLQPALPEGWTLLSPWGPSVQKVSVAGLRNVYLGLGPLQTTTVQNGPAALLFGFYQGLNATSAQELRRAVPALFLAMQEITQVAPAGHTPAWALTILPAEPIHGGASGTGSLVVEDDLAVVAHEVFHWWNGATVPSSIEAGWFKEGFTVYYTGKALYQAGLWSEAEFTAYRQEFASKSGLDRETGPVDLNRASRRLQKEGRREDYNRVYYGGALLADYLDRRLQEQGKSLDLLWPALREHAGTVTPEVLMQELEKLGGPELAAECMEMVEGKREIPTR